MTCIAASSAEAADASMPASSTNRSSRVVAGDQPAGALVTHLTVVEVLLVPGVGGRVVVRLFLPDPLVERLAGMLLGRRVAEALAG